MAWPPHILPAIGARITPRTIDEAECVVSVLVAIVFAHALGATNVSWAAFSGYMVMRGHAAETVSRGMLRIVGTIAGGLFALAVAPLLVSSHALTAVALLAIGTASLYGALVAKRAYAWLFFGLTFAMILLDTIEHPAIALPAFVATRILETGAGTIACMAVSLASTLTLRRRWPAIHGVPATGLGWHRDGFRHAAQGGVALALLVAVSAAMPVPALAQGAVTIMAVMLVPVSHIGVSGLHPVGRRIAHRFAGCIAGGALAAVVLAVAHGSAPVLILGSAIGVAIGRHLENGAHGRRYVGTQFTLAVLVTLVPDSYDHAAIAPGLERLSGILVGMAVLVPVLFVWHLLAPARPIAPGGEAAVDEGGGV